MPEPRTRNSKPTTKQLNAIQNIVENGGNVSKGMRDAGYSPQTAKNPNKLTESKAFQEIMYDRITDTEVIEVIKEGLHANEMVRYGDGDGFVTPDHKTRHKFVETIIKVRGYAKDTNANANTINFNIKGSASFNSGDYKK